MDDFFGSFDAPKTAEEKKPVESVVAIFDFEAQDAGDLGFKGGCPCKTTKKFFAKISPQKFHSRNTVQKFNFLRPLIFATTILLRLGIKSMSFQKKAIGGRVELEVEKVRSQFLVYKV